VDLVWCVLEPELGFEELVPCPFATAPVTPIPAATSSVRARWVAFGTRIGFRFCASGDASVSPVLLLLAVRRNDTGQEDGKNAVVLAAQNLKDHVDTGLQLSNCCAVVIQRSNRVMVDFRDHIAATEV
jgi:hypothetical protein